MRGRKKSEDTRRAIVQCAAETFSEREFHEVLTDEIAQRLGIGKGTIYRYFASKEDLYLAAINEGLSGLHSALTSALRLDAPLATMVEAVARTMFSYFWHRRDFFVLVHRLEAKLAPEERAEWRNRRNVVNGMVCRVIDRAIARGEIPSINARLAVEALFGMIRALCVYRNEHDRPEDLTHLVMTIFLRGVAGDAGTPAGRALKVIKGGTQG